VHFEDVLLDDQASGNQRLRDSSEQVMPPVKVDGQASRWVIGYAPVVSSRDIADLLE
jgi:hypothetical protein